jgi:crotonobetainyl-CoA:carnitine CoA-transferase CaiB-like acyl-CoA transferase
MIAEAAGPLAGVRVIDMTTSYAGPTATMYLADMGAEVVKLERPERGDDTRGWGPPFAGGESAWFLSANRNKRSACIDLSTDAGLEVLEALLSTADVFVENVNPRKLRGMGIDPESVRARHPELIYCAISGFGLEGPDAHLPGYDLIAQARSGLMSVTGERGRLPQRVSTALCDSVAGTVAAFAIAAALRRQAITGEGDLIDVTLLDAGLALMAPRIASFLAGEPEPRPSGASDSVLSVYQGFETADRPIVIAVGNDGMWARLCELLDLQDLGSDPGLDTNAGRRARRDEILAATSERLKTRTAGEWLDALAEAGIPAATIQFLSEVTTDQHVRARRSIDRVAHPIAGDVELVSAPWRLASDNDAPPRRSAPSLGADTVEILRDAGLSCDQIKELLHGGVVWSGQAPAA